MSEIKYKKNEEKYYKKIQERKRLTEQLRQERINGIYINCRKIEKKIFNLDKKLLKIFYKMGNIRKW